jgi:hypothetical protein
MLGCIVRRLSGVQTALSAVAIPDRSAMNESHGLADFVFGPLAMCSREMERRFRTLGDVSSAAQAVPCQWSQRLAIARS